MIPRIGTPPKKGQVYTPRPGAYSILPTPDGLLLTGVEDDIFDIQLPGGGIDPGESPLQALHREVLEETGWSIAHPQRVGVFRHFVFMPEYDLWAEKICTVYAAHPVRQMQPPSEPDHFTVILPVLDALDALQSDGNRLMLRRYLAMRDA